MTLFRVGNPAGGGILITSELDILVYYRHRPGQIPVDG
jgi:hypothetical protein